MFAADIVNREILFAKQSVTGTDKTPDQFLAEFYSLQSKLSESTIIKERKKQLLEEGSASAAGVNSQVSKNRIAINAQFATVTEATEKFFNETIKGANSNATQLKKIETDITNTVGDLNEQRKKIILEGVEAEIKAKEFEITEREFNLNRLKKIAEFEGDIFVQSVRSY